MVGREQGEGQSVCVCVCQLMEAGGWVRCRVGRVTVSVRESDKVEVTLCKAPLKHENDKDDMPYTSPELSRVKSFSFNFPIIRTATTVHCPVVEFLEQY
jgi:hypothetical protein